MAHPLSLGKRHQGGEMKTPNLSICLFHEVVAQDNVHMPVADRPLEQTHLVLDLTQHLDIRARPSTTDVVKEGILGPPVI